MVDAEVGDARQLVVARRGGENGCAGPLRQLHRRKPDATGGRLHQHRFARLQSPKLEETVVGGAERDRHARALDQVGAIGDRPRRRIRHAHQLGVRTVGHRDDDALVDDRAGGRRLLADLDDRSRALITDDVLGRGEHAAGAVQHVAAFDADRLDPDQDAGRTQLWIGDVGVFENVRRSRARVRGGFHIHDRNRRPYTPLMAKIVMAGGGICGMGAAMMLARRGHEVTVLERNAEEPPDTIEKAWDVWDRPGVGQFRQGHYFLARWHQIMKAELPDLLPRFDAVGALRVNPALDGMPPGITDRERRADDDQFDVITGRRPVFEWVIANAVREEPNIDLRRGVGVSGLLTGPSVVDGVPHVVGVGTDNGDELQADLVIDSGGRRSALGAWLTEIGARPFSEDSQDSGFRYYGRYFRAGPGGWPAPALPTLAVIGTAAILALPGDNDTWMVGIVASAKDKALYPLTDDAAWEQVIARTPTVAPFLAGEPISELESMIGIPDRIRRFVVDGSPVVTGLAPIADAWAATNPMRGRGISMGFMQSKIVIDNLDKLDDPAAFALAVDAQVEADVAPHYHGTIELDRVMRESFEREVNGEEPPPHDPDDPIAAMQAKFFSLIPFDADVWRGFVKIVNLIEQPLNVVANEPVLSKVLAYDGPILNPMIGEGPSRAELVEIAASAKSVARPPARWDDLVAN